jgi:Fe2+ or Zn2+ uptake regulation protein
VRDRLRDVDQLYTPARRRLVELLAEAARPLTIPQLVDEHPEVAVSSAYRNMGVLEQVGVVSRIVSGVEHARFELAEGVLGDHHHHLICQSCGRVDDFTVSDTVEKTIERELAKVAAGSAFVAVAHRLDLVGTCGGCATAS